MDARFTWSVTELIEKRKDGALLVVRSYMIPNSSLGIVDGTPVHEVISQIERWQSIPE